jgi:hypothetical protein
MKKGDLEEQYQVAGDAVLVAPPGKFPANRKFHRETGDSGGSETALCQKTLQYSALRVNSLFPNREMILS